MRVRSWGLRRKRRFAERRAVTVAFADRSIMAVGLCGLRVDRTDARPSKPRTNGGVILMAFADRVNRDNVQKSP